MEKIHLYIKTIFQFRDYLCYMEYVVGMPRGQ